MASPHAQPGVASRRPAPIYATRGAKRRITAERLGNPAFADYLHQIDAGVLLDAAAEKLLGHLLINGRPAKGCEGPMTLAAHTAREGLITSNLRLVVVVAACYADPGVPLPDIVSAGNIGLITAVDKYLPGRARFGTHATWWIRQACSYYVMTHGPLIHIPRGVMQGQRRMQRAQAHADAAGETLDENELMARASVTPSEVARAANAHISVVSLDTPITNGDGDDMTLADTIADDTSAPVETHALEDDAITELHHHMATALTSLERRVLTLRYGLGDRDGLCASITETATELAISRVKARELEGRALAQLRTAYGVTAGPQRLARALIHVV